ncbi:3-dehydroshikimate dehydratase [compost metagenome]
MSQSKDDGIGQDSKIRYSMCSTGLKQHSLEKVLEIASDCGLQGIEIWSGHIEEYLSRGHHLIELKSQLSSYQLEVPAISGYTYLSRDEDYKEELNQIDTAAQWCRALDCPRIRTFLGHSSSQVILASEWEKSIQRLDEALGICESLDVKLAVEIHNHTFADTSDSLAAMFRDVKGVSLELIFDGFNLFVDSLEPIPVLEQFFSWIHHVHFKDYRWNHQDWSLSVPVPVLQGDGNHTAILNKLLELEYEGMISFEYFGDNAIPNTRKSLLQVQDYIKKYESVK